MSSAVAEKSSARHNCKQAIQDLVPPELWQRNLAFSREVLELIESHPLLQHPVIAALGNGSFPPEVLRRLHLEFRYTFAQTFTDGLLHAMQHAAQLEPRFGSLGKVSARFLLAFNLFDELGFRPAAEDYAGTPRNSHYYQFHVTLGELGVSETQAQAYVPSDAAVAIRRMVEGAYADPIALLCVLAVEETVFEKFAGPWAQNMKLRTAVNTRDGYHSIHVEHDGGSVDDHHAEDLWYVFRMMVEPRHYDDVRRRTVECLDALVRFVDHLARA
jgi:hypothetical protein